MPDLILIDGGLGQLHAAQSALDALSANSPDRLQRLAAALHRLIAAVKRVELGQAPPSPEQIYSIG
jgi:excinuclease UvrABC nuclease subunit